MKSTWAFRKISKVPSRAVVPTSALAYQPRYAPPRRMSLSSSFDSVTEKNRFTALEILLRKLSGHVGRRQYRMSCNLSIYLDKLTAMGVDWHELKYLQQEELEELLNKELAMNHAEKVVLLTALDAKVCGVLRRSTTRHSTSICLNRGCREHGWRCGRHGHTNDVYFEGKEKANPAVLQLSHRTISRVAKRAGIDVEVHHAPDFTIMGRHSVELSPRIWSTPQNPSFAISPIGYEFRVHPDDPRAVYQIEAAAAEWELHQAVLQQVISEMLELYAVERAEQPLVLRSGEVGQPDLPEVYSSAFNSTGATPGLPEDAKPEQRVVERRMLTASGTERPWFQTPLPQRFTHGIPDILPFAPTVIIHSAFRQVGRSLHHDDITKQLMQPVLDISCYLHPDACFWWSSEKEEVCMRHILDYAKRVPFALPFNLYFRVDPAKVLRGTPSAVEERERLAAAKSHFFDLRHFRASAVAKEPAL